MGAPIEDDVKTGRLNHLIAEAEADSAAGRGGKQRGREAESVATVLMLKGLNPPTSLQMIDVRWTDEG